ncbi:MAG: L-sorbosone dehydrogenase [Labilithrix sp.]|nr:L-sorbosone dehydrogenase [Labilithrix sp.]
MRSFAGLLFACVAASCSRSANKVADPPGTPTAPVLGTLLTGDAAKGDYRTDAPGVRRKLTVADLPPPNDTPSVDNGPHIVKRPAGASPQVPAGFEVSLFAADLDNPRQARVAPNGDLFVVESEKDRIRVLRDADGDGKPELVKIFAEGLKQPFGVAFWPPGPAPKWVYVANTDAVLRFPYVDGDVTARGTAETVVEGISGGGHLRGGGHWTRDVVFSNDGSRMFVSIGSRSNVSDDAEEERRARIFEYTPEGKNGRVYASGIRNAVGLAVHPRTGELWASVNERDELGDHLVPDYVTRVREGGFYGWPWFYLGAHQDPRHAGKHAELAGAIAVPDVLLQSHSASLGMMFYAGTAFPAEYQGSAFAAEHGSWNRARRTGYKVINIPVVNGVPTGEYVDFMTGFVTPDGDVWGRPVAVAQARDGGLYVTDDGGECVWKIRRK